MEASNVGRRSPPLSPTRVGSQAGGLGGTQQTSTPNASAQQAQNPGQLAALVSNRTTPATPGAASMAPRARPNLRLGGRPGLSLNLAAINQPQGVDLARLRAASNGSTHFHGSRSGSLIAFHASTPEDSRGSLLPMGKLRETGAPVLSGERGNSLADNAFNHAHLSVVDEAHIDGAIKYATDTGYARKSPVATLSEADKAFGGEAKQEVADTANQALHALKDSDPAMHEMVGKNFAVVYGLKPDGNRLRGVSSDIAGEAGVKDGVKPEEIGAIFVPQEHVASVQALVNGSGHQIPVAALESFKA